MAAQPFCAKIYWIISHNNGDGGDPDADDITPQTRESGHENAANLKKHRKEALCLQLHSTLLIVSSSEKKVIQWEKGILWEKVTQCENAAYLKKHRKEAPAYSLTHCLI